MPTFDPSRSASDLPESLERELLSIFDVAGPSLGMRIAAVAAEHPKQADAIRRWYDEAQEFATSPVAERRIAGYRLIRLLGRGGMGEVYLAQHLELGRLVALKLMRGDTSFSPAMRARFAREARVVSGLDHPNICPVHEVGEDGGQPFMAMRWIRGRSLAELIREQLQPATAGAAREATAVTPSPSNRRQIQAVLSMMEKVARALHVAHEQGLVHRDVKPGNIMLADDGEPVVLDFGLAREWADDRAGLTNSSALLGTPLYMAPEQVDPDRGAVGPCTDVYALGATLYECLTLCPPLDSEPSHNLNQRILDVDPLPASRRNRALPGDIDVILSRAMDKDPERRYATAGDLADDLRRLRLDEPIAARRTGVLRRTVMWTRRNPGASAVLAVMSLALLITTKLVFALRTAEASERAVAADKDVASAEALARDGDFARALRSFAEALQRGYPDRTRVLLGRLVCYDGLADLESVAEVIEELADKPDHGRYAARVLLARADNLLWSEGDKAWPLLDEAIDLHRTGKAELSDTELAYAKACRQDDLDAFVAGLEATRQIDPKHYPALTALGYARILQGRTDLALTLADQAAALYPQDPYGPGLSALAHALAGRREDCAAAVARLARVADDRAEQMARLLPKVLDLVWTAQEVSVAYAINPAQGLPPNQHGDVDVPRLAGQIVRHLTTLLQVGGSGQFLGRIRAHPGIWRQAIKWVDEDVKPNIVTILAYVRDPMSPRFADGGASLIRSVTERAPDPLLRMVHQIALSRSAGDERAALQAVVDSAQAYFKASGISGAFAGARRCVLALAVSSLRTIDPGQTKMDNQAWARGLIDQSLPNLVPEVCRMDLADEEFGAWVKCSSMHSDPNVRAMLVQRVLSVWRERAGQPSRAHLLAAATWAQASGQQEVATATLTDLLRRWPDDTEAKGMLEAWRGAASRR